MEERERPRERVCERDGEESWDQGGSRDVAGFIQSGVRRRSFGVESKIFEVETERKKGRTQIFIVERKGGVSSWVKLGPASLGPLMEGLAFCIKDTRTGHWEKFWQENGRTFSLTRGENKGGCFLRLGVTDREKKRFNIFVPKGKGTKGGWALLVEALREMEPGSDGQKGQQVKEKCWSPMLGKSFAEVVKQNCRSGEEVVRVKIDNRPSGGRLEKLAQCLVGSWDPMLGRGDDLRSWGTQMSKLWGLKGNLGLAKLEDGKALLEFELRTEAEKALKNGVISISGFDVRLEKWSQRMGCVMEEEKKREAWVRILGLPISLWDRDTLCKIGEGCGEFLDIDAKTERMEELQWARIRVRIKEERIPNMVDIWAENMCYSVAFWWETRPTVRMLQADENGKTLAAAGEGEDEGQTREGKRVMEDEGGSRLEVQTQVADGMWRPTAGAGQPTDCPHGMGGSHRGLQGMERMHGGPLVMGLLEKSCGPGGPTPHPPFLDHVGPNERVDFRRPKIWKPREGVGLVAEGPSVETSLHSNLAQICGPSRSRNPAPEDPLLWEKNDMRRLSEAELIQYERSLTDLALPEEAMRYDKVFSHSDCLVSGTPSLSSPFFGRTPVGEYYDLSGDDKERDEGENPIQMIMGTKSPTGENVECWDLVEVNKSRIEDGGKEMVLDQIVPHASKVEGELSWEQSDLAKFSKFLGFSTEGLEKDIMDFLVKIRKRRERVHSKTLLEKSKFERELRRLECSINYERGKKQNGGEQVRGCQITEV